MMYLKTAVSLFVYLLVLLFVTYVFVWFVYGAFWFFGLVACVFAFGGLFVCLCVLLDFCWLHADYCCGFV